LRQQGLTDQDITIVVTEAIIKKQCKALSLSENNITSAGVSILTDALNNNSNTLERLSLYGNAICDDGLRFLVENLLNTNKIIKRLNLNKTGITDIGAEYLTRMLKTNQTLTELCLNENEISDTGVRRLVNVIKNNNTTIELLRLSSNKRVTDESVNDLIQMIETNRSLRELDVSDCQLSDISKKKLEDAHKLREDFVLFV